MQATEVSNVQVKLSIPKPAPSPDPPSAILKRLRLYAAVFLMTLLLCEAGARFITALAQPPMRLPLSLYRKADLAQKPPDTNRPGLLFLGNSLMYMALYPELLGARLTDAGVPVEVRNLASPSNSSFMDLVLLKKAVESGFKPRVVFLGAGIDFLRELDTGKTVNRLEQTFRENYLYRCQLTKPTGMTGKAECMVEKLSYLYRYRGHFKEMLNELPNMLLKPERVNRKENWTAPKEDYVHFEISQSGWSPAFRVYSREAYQQEMVRSRTGQVTIAKLKASLEETRRYRQQPPFQELVAYCEQQGISIVLVALPGYSYPGLNLSSPPEYRKIQQLDRQTASAYLKKHPMIRLIDLSADDDPSHYIDRGHMNAVGAVTFTERLAEVLKSESYRQLFTKKSGTPPGAHP
jgi:hypothetical protein